MVLDKRNIKFNEITDPHDAMEALGKIGVIGFNNGTEIYFSDHHPDLLYEFAINRININLVEVDVNEFKDRRIYDRRKET